MLTKKYVQVVVNFFYSFTISILSIYSKLQSTYARQAIYLSSINHLHVYCRPSKRSLQAVYKFVLIQLFVYPEFFSRLQKNRLLFIAQHLRVYCKSFFFITLYNLLFIKSRQRFNLNPTPHVLFSFFPFTIDHLLVWMAH